MVSLLPPDKILHESLPSSQIATIRSIVHPDNLNAFRGGLTKAELEFSSSSPRAEVDQCYRLLYMMLVCYAFLL